MITEVMVAAKEVEIETEEPTKKEDKDTILKEIRMSQHDLQIYQDCPNTFVSIKFIYKGITLETFGFAKANWPDPWDAEYGINLAIEKAFYKAARMLLETPVEKLVSPIAENRIQR
jgi:hypothetical protein